MMIIKEKFSKDSQFQSGQSLVELALTITILLTLLAGAFDLGNAFLDYIALRDAAQEGAVYASIYPTDPSAVFERVLKSSDSPVDFEQLSFEETCSIDSHKGICVDIPTPCTGNNETESGKSNEVTVTIRYHYPIIMPFLGAIIGNQFIPLQASATNVILTTLCE